jgi:Putative zinc-finger
MRPHVSAEKLAEFRQGDLSPRRTARIRAHLARCARCRALNEDLAGVTALLASVPPPPIPDHLTARIQTALATEATRRVTLPADHEAGQAPVPASHETRRARVPASHRTGRRRPRRTVVLRGVAAAAAVVVLGGGAYAIVQSSSGGSTSSARSGAASAPEARRAAGQPAHAGPLRSGEASFGPALRYTRAGHQASVTPITTGTNYSAGKLNSEVATEVSKYGTGFATSGPDAMSSSQGQRSAAEGDQRSFGNVSVSALQGCVNRIAAGELVLLVDVARYRNTPATIIVTEAAQTAPEQIWVVGTGCSASRSDVLEHTTARAAS